MKSPYVNGVVPKGHSRAFSGIVIPARPNRFKGCTNPHRVVRMLLAHRDRVPIIACGQVPKLLAALDQAARPGV